VESTLKSYNATVHLWANHKAPESDDMIRESPGMHLLDKERGLRDRSNSEYYSEANFRHGGCKKRETITPKNVGGNLGDDFFDDIESCLTELVNLDEVPSFDLLLPFSFHKR